jgi:hypothetical protein
MSCGFTNCGDNLIAGICVFYFVDKVGMLVHAVYDKSFEKPGVSKLSSIIFAYPYSSAI